MQLLEALGSLKVHEMRLSKRNVREEDQALLTRAMSKLSYETTKRVSKLEDRSNENIFTSYELGTKAYWCLGPHTFKVSISRDVVFEEYQR